MEVWAQYHANAAEKFRHRPRRINRGGIPCFEKHYKNMSYQRRSQLYGFGETVFKILSLVESGDLITLRYQNFRVRANPDESKITILPTLWERFTEQTLFQQVQSSKIERILFMDAQTGRFFFISVRTGPGRGNLYFLAPMDRSINFHRFIMDLSTQ